MVFLISIANFVVGAFDIRWAAERRAKANNVLSVALTRSKSGSPMKSAKKKSLSRVEQQSSASKPNRGALLANRIASHLKKYEGMSELIEVRTAARPAQLAAAVLGADHRQNAGLEEAAASEGGKQTKRVQAAASYMLINFVSSHTKTQRLRSRILRASWWANSNCAIVVKSVLVPIATRWQRRLGSKS